MFESKTSLFPVIKDARTPTALVVGFEEDDLSELGLLLKTLEYQIVDQVITVLRKVSPATYLGRGKVEEIKERFEENKKKPDVLVIDAELSPNQLRNLEKIFGIPTFDRASVIIEIFSRHARTKEAKTQVELARLNYLLPRLVHFWSHFERQRGGIGLKGMGEKQIEVDRRLLKKRIQILNRKLSDIQKEREVQRVGRKDILKVALVGYTNAGKSTLLNQLTQSHVLAEDKLFATLDSSVRMLDPDSHPPVVAIDTVGFISRIPPGLVASFRSTLEELEHADLLLHVVDASSKRAKEQIEVTEETLNEIGLKDKPRLIVLNKADLLDSASRVNQSKLVAPGAMQISAFDSEAVRKLRDKILDFFKGNLQVWEVVIPYDRAKIESQIYAYGSVETVKYLEKGTFFRVRMAKSWAEKLGLNKFQF